MLAEGEGCEKRERPAPLRAAITPPATMTLPTSFRPVQQVNKAGGASFRRWPPFAAVLLPQDSPPDITNLDARKGFLSIEKKKEKNPQNYVFLSLIS